MKTLHPVLHVFFVPTTCTNVQIFLQDHINHRHSTHVPLGGKQQQQQQQPLNASSYLHGGSAGGGGSSNVVVGSLAAPATVVSSCHASSDHIYAIVATPESRRGGLQVNSQGVGVPVPQQNR